MITISKVSSGGQALGYYSERDDYYREGGSAPARFFGEGAASLGLTGPVVRDSAVQFAEVLEGRVAGQQIGQADRHTPGWDVTFSAPKSASIAALTGDDRLVAAHDEAVHAALAHLERHAIVTRQRGAEGEYVWKQGDGMTAAVFRHTTSRNADPQLHSHSVMANVTRDPETGAWRSIDSREIYAAQTEANVVYMNTLAHGAREAGYTVDWTINDKGHPSFELREVPEALREAWSSRKAEIDAALEARGLSRETASANEKQVATLETRAPKDVQDRAALAADWRMTARTYGYEPEQRPQGRVLDAAERAAAADTAVHRAAEHLAERDARFSARDLAHEARIASQGQAGEKAIQAAIERAQQAGALQARRTWGRSAGGQRDWREGYTTREGLRTERALLGHAAALQREGAVRIGETPGAARSAAVRQAAIERVIAVREQATGRAFSAEQCSAVNTLLDRSSALQILHGYAGTAKTTSVLAAVAEVAREGGWQVRTLAPTGSAAQTLGQALGLRDETVSAALARKSAEHLERAVWIVDEAGMVAARDMEKLLERARVEQAHVLLVGDTRQIGSVGAGAAFTQLREQLGSENLTEIVRQRHEGLRQAVYDTLAGKTTDALRRIEVHEIKPAKGQSREDGGPSVREQAIERIATRYRDATGQGKDTLVIGLSRADRADLNSAIHAQRIAAGQVRDLREVAVLDSKQWTATQRTDAARYQPGDRIEWGRTYQGGPGKSEITSVVSVRDGRITVERENGTQWTFDPRQLTRLEVHDAKTLEIGAGSKIVTRGPIQAQRDDGSTLRLPTGSTLTVIGQDTQHLHVRDVHGQVLKLDTTRALRLDHAYAMTAAQAQGKTADMAIAWMRSSQQNLSTLDRLYVALSRARDSAVLVTDNAGKLAARLEMNRGGNETALTPTATHAAMQRGALGEAIAQRAEVRDREAGRATPSPAAERNPDSHERLQSMIESARQRDGASLERSTSGREWSASR